MVTAADAVMVMMMMMTAVMMVVMTVVVVSMPGRHVFGYTLRLDDCSTIAADDGTEAIRFGTHSIQRHIALVQSHHIVLGLHAGHSERNTADGRTMAGRR